MEPGTRLGVYEILGPLGAGGMGEVYRARDATLQREVALKLLPQDVAEDPERLARLKREARALAALNHAHVATVHGFEEQDGTSFIVMELVDGETLAEKLERGPLSVEETFALAIQIAGALEAAHRRGIVHRDLKPANVKIMPSGDAKVLDFGLATSVRPGSGEVSETAHPTAAGMTRTGAVMGTPPYMSPEQVRGMKPDGRVDIWAFGCVLYEMLTGRNAFAAQTAGDTLSAVLTREPDWDSLPPDTPASMRALLRRCLRKDRDRRLQHIDDARIEIEDALGESEPDSAEQRAVPERRRSWRRPAPWALAGLLTLATAAIVIAWFLGGLSGGIPRSGSGGPAPEIRALAVLPLENLSGDPEQQYFVDGVHEDILNQLSTIEDLVVLARRSVLRYQDGEKGVREIAAELGADAVLTGTVRRVGDDIRISAQLIDPNTEGQLWARTYDRRLDDVFAVQTEIARSVARSLEATLSPGQDLEMARRPTESLAAYDLYLKGREAYRLVDEEENSEATRLFRAALDLDPGYALAWAGLADTFSQRARLFGDTQRWADEAVAAARRALEIDPELADGHKALGEAYQVQEQHGEALDAYLEALQLDPNQWAALLNTGTIHYSAGRFDQAILVLRRAARLAPTELEPRWDLAHTYKFLKLDEAAREWNEAILILDPEHVGARLMWPQLAIYRGENEQALEQAEEIVQDSPDDSMAWAGAAGIAYVAGEFDVAIDRARRFLEIAPDSTQWYWHNPRVVLGISLLRSDQREEGREVLDRAIAEQERTIARGDVDYEPYWHLAAAYAALGDGDAALKHLQQSYDLGFRFVRWAPIDPAFDQIRDDPRYRKIMADIEAHVSAMRERVIEQERAAGIR